MTELIGLTRVAPPGFYVIFQHAHRYPFVYAICNMGQLTDRKS